MEKKSNRLFMGVFPCGIVYADRFHEVHGDYKKVAFLSYNTLKLEFYSCPQELKVEIEKNTKQFIKGKIFQISSIGQTITLGDHI